MYDTIFFGEPIPCPRCGERIPVLRTGAFERCLDEFHIGSCVEPPDVTRVVQEQLFCDCCQTHPGSPIFLAVRWGILVGIELSEASAWKAIKDFGEERLVSWLHRWSALKSESDVVIWNCRAFLEALANALDESPPLTHQMNPYYPTLRDCTSLQSAISAFLIAHPNPAFAEEKPRFPLT